MQKNLFFSFLLTLFVVACSPKEESIYIITTNDMHATIDAFPKLATIVKEYERRGTVLLADSGDRVSGNAYVDDAAEAGVPIVELMNAVGYDVVTVGNHEFDKGHEVLQTMVDRSEFRWVAANVGCKQPQPKFEPYATFDIEGVKIGFVGVVSTENEGFPLGRRAAYEEFTFENDYDSALSTCQAIAPEHNFVVLLSHMGYDMDLNFAKSENNGCDWVAGAHSHDLKNELVGTTQITQNNKNLRYVTIAKLSIVEGEITAVEYERIDTSSIDEDSATRELVEKIKLSDPTLNEVIATANADATHDGVANLTVEALAHYPYPNGFVPEITFYHFGGVRTSELKKGDVRRVDILNNDPFLSTIYLGEMTPAQMRKFIIDKYNSGTPERPDKESHYPYFRSDIEYEIILDKKGDATDIKFELDEDKKYRVAMGNYIAESYIDKELVSSALYDTNISVREAMLHYVSTLSEGYTPDNTIHQTEVKPTK